MDDSTKDTPLVFFLNFFFCLYFLSLKLYPLKSPISFDSYLFSLLFHSLVFSFVITLSPLTYVRTYTHFPCFMMGSGSVPRLSRASFYFI